MKYEDQLNCVQWAKKRNVIIERDQYRCQQCYNKSLIDKFRISFYGVGTTTSKKLWFIVYDKFKKTTYRIHSNFDKSFLVELKEIHEINSILCLSEGESDFCKLIVTIVLPLKLDYSSIKNLKDIDRPKFLEQAQLIQEEYLKFLSSEELKRLKWIDTRGLHVHHKYYQVGKFAWEYPDSALITLCWTCHEKLHANSMIEVLNESGNVIGERQVCPRCFGAGRFPEYSHIQNGICFKCNGNRFSQ